MSSFVQRFVRVKTSVGGNRERKGFEYTFGMPKEAQMDITEIAWHARRALTQLDFAIKINDGAFDKEIDRALAILESGLEKDGTLTRVICQSAEAALLPMQSKAKEYEVLACAHAHIDMNWMWGFHETVASTLATFRTMLTLMDEYPQFTFSQSQASVYKIVEEYDPDMMPRIKERIREGRWEVTAAAWVETDKNMPDTESLLRHVRYTRQYLHDVWGIDEDSLQIDFSPDTFGHSAHLPELNAYADVKYYYHCRGYSTDKVLYRWRAPSGREVLCYREPYWYNSGITPDIGTGLPQLVSHMGGMKTGLIVYGVGDHGGGPTRKDVERMLDMQEWPIFPKLTFSTFRAFFERAERVRDNLPVVEHELNTIFPGCYTTQSRIKRANRMSEAALLSGEALCAAASCALSVPYPRARLTNAWQKVLFTHFHDILPGSCTQESREYAMGLFQEALATAQTEGERAARALSDAIDTSMIAFDQNNLTQSEGAGAGYGLKNLSGMPSGERGRGMVRVFHVFNSLPFAHGKLTEITVWDWTGDIGLLRVTDERGEPLAFQLIDTTLQHSWDHKYFRLLVAVDLPALGYCTVVLNQREREEYPTYRLNYDRVADAQGDITLENDRLLAKFDGRSGELISLFDKQAGVERAKDGYFAFVKTESATSSAWKIGRHLSPALALETTRVELLPGALRQGLKVTQRGLASSLDFTVTLDKDAAALEYTMEIDWNEAARKDESVPVLEYITTPAQAASCARYDVPAGASDRPAAAMDQAGLTHAACVFGKDALMLATDSKYGYRYDNGRLSATLINTAANPDPYPERGKHYIKLWLALSDAAPKALRELALSFTRPPVCIAATCHKGVLPPTRSLLAFRSDSAVVSSVQIARDGALALRLYEANGEHADVSLTLSFTPVRAALCDGEGRLLSEARISGNIVRFTIPPYSLASVKVWKA